MTEIMRALGHKLKPTVYIASVPELAGPAARNAALRALTAGRPAARKPRLGSGSYLAPGARRRRAR